MKDYYRSLNLTKDATAEDIKKAHRSLAKQHHPDRNPGDKDAETKFKEIQEAYDVLSDPSQRSQYDNPSPFNGGFPGGDIFEHFFNFKREPSNKGQHVETEVVIDFMEALNGCVKSVVIDRREACVSCKGTGAKNGSEFKKCVTCDGKGKSYQNFNSGLGVLRMENTCSVCHGSGKAISVRCPECDARGFLMKNVTLSINIPAGVDNGMKIGVQGQGDVGLNGTGNLYCGVRVRPHFLFQRQDNDIIITVPVSYTQATKGAKLELPFPRGVCEFNLPSGTKSGSLFRLDGLGVVGSRRGDLLVRVEIDIPKELPEEYHQFLTKLGELENKYPSPLAVAFREKVKKLEK